MNYWCTTIGKLFITIGFPILLFGIIKINRVFVLLNERFVLFLSN